MLPKETFSEAFPLRSPYMPCMIEPSPLISIGLTPLLDVMRVVAIA